MCSDFSQLRSLLCATLGLLVVTLLFGCEEVIDSPFEIIDSKLVLSSTFAPNQPVTVRVTATQPVTGEVTLSEVSSAQVSLFEGPALIEDLMYIPGENEKLGTYQTQTFKPQVGHRYTVHAIADGFIPVSAESRIPALVPITSISIAELSIINLIDRDVFDYQLLVNYDDPPHEDNFYDLRISQQVIPFRVSPLNDTLFYEPVLKSVQPPGYGYNTAPAVGGQASVLLSNKPSQEGLIVHLQSIIQPEEEILGSIVAELRTVAEPYYRFQLNVQGDGTVSGGIVEPAVNVYTNVNAGYGVFAGYNSSKSVLNF